ncbi:aminotransferase class I/II-fold pyridoxal phosphate-dependent enzyme [Methanolobus vulcani]|uniref:Aminotransferase class I/II-fold pyridoxal phosphate-dependent enzyme n=1 Tax=Methanolobus vulcani TaxID=38026 RepID=A0A7Z8KME4_9EURY|nr:aminotransferase class I/II-fold pyridoxal phosphate-dependent enzyme [Methanolobus vulcani]TQD24407.1 aminotransferase class I/II-fold pyridoxal phosphate-dependent enzyme [Methanolobus vulcani]
MRFNKAESDILDFTSNTNPLGTPFNFPASNLDLNQTVLRSTERIDQYPDNRYLELRKAAASYVGHNISADNIIPGNGTCELLRLIMETVVNEEDIVITTSPSSGEYRHIAEVFGARIHSFTTDELLHLPKMTLDRAKVIVIGNPNNPTGQLIPKDNLSDFAQKCAEHGTLLIVDESAIELADPDMSIVGLTLDNDHLFVIRSISNITAMPGIRLAYGIASLSLANMLNSARLSWNIGVTDEAIGLAFLSMEGGPHSEYLTSSRKFIKNERKYIIKRFSGIYGFDPVESSTNYILIDVKDLFLDSARLSEGLAMHGILIRECSDFFDGNKRYVRLSIRSRDDFEKLIHTLDTVFAETSREDAREKLEETIEHGGSSSAGRGTCEYYPCHFTGQDCTFCFCPFYACEDERTGGKWIESSTGGNVWSCEHCTILHRPKVAKMVLDALMADGDTDDNIRRAWKEIIVPLL